MPRLCVLLAFFTRLYCVTFNSICPSHLVNTHLGLSSSNCHLWYFTVFVLSSHLIIISFTSVSFLSVFLFSNFLSNKLTWTDLLSFYGFKVKISPSFRLFSFFTSSHVLDHSSFMFLWSNNVNKFMLKYWRKNYCTEVVLLSCWRVGSFHDLNITNKTYINPYLFVCIFVCLFVWKCLIWIKS